MTETAAADSLRRTALRWFAGGLAAAPLGILPHEIGHYLVLLALGVPDLALHFVGVTWDLEEFWAAVMREDYASAAAIAPLLGGWRSPTPRARWSPTRSCSRAATAARPSARTRRSLLSRTSPRPASRSPVIVLGDPRGPTGRAGGGHGRRLGRHLRLRGHRRARRRSDGSGLRSRHRRRTQPAHGRAERSVRRHPRRSGGRHLECTGRGPSPWQRTHSRDRADSRT